jgi:Preprotein translocase subunit SecF
VLSIASVILYFYPGLNYGIDFRGGIVIEARTSGPADFARCAPPSTAGLGEAALQQFGGPNDVLIRLERQPGGDEAQQVAVEKVRTMLTQKFPGTELRRVEAVGATVSDTLFQNGMIAWPGAGGHAVYIWFRFEWQFGVGAVRP